MYNGVKWSRFVSYMFFVCFYYARKQLMLSARLSHRNSVCPSIRLSVRLSHGWIR